MIRWLIYRVKCTINGKLYIGLTKQTIARRKMYHERDAKNNKYNIKFHNALRKHGFGVFYWDILCSCKTKKDAEYMERYFIKTLNTYEKGYNSTFGGDGFSGKAIDKKKISDTLKNIYHKKPGTRLKHSRERGGFSVYVWDLSGKLIGKFDTQIECCEKLNLRASKVCNCLKGLRRSHEGYVFSAINQFPQLVANCSKAARNKPVKVYSKETGDLLGSYKSLLEASKALNFSRKAISQYIEGLIKTKPKHNYHFEYGVKNGS